MTGCCLEAQCLLVDRDDDLSVAGEEVELSVLEKVKEWGSQYSFDQTLGLLYRPRTVGVAGCCLGTRLIRTLIPCIRWGSGALRCWRREVCGEWGQTRLLASPTTVPLWWRPGHAGPTTLITADSPTLALTLLQTLPSGLLYRLLDLLGGRQLAAVWEPSSQPGDGVMIEGGVEVLAPDWRGELSVWSHSSSVSLSSPQLILVFSETECMTRDEVTGSLALSTSTQMDA